VGKVAVAGGKDGFSIHRLEGRIWWRGLGEVWSRSRSMNEALDDDPATGKRFRGLLLFVFFYLWWSRRFCRVVCVFCGARTWFLRGGFVVIGVPSLVLRDHVAGSRKFSSVLRFIFRRECNRRSLGNEKQKGKQRQRQLLIPTVAAELFARQGLAGLGALLSSLEEEVAFAGVAGKGGGAGEFDLGFGVAVKFGEEVATYAG